MTAKGRVLVLYSVHGGTVQWGHLIRHSSGIRSRMPSGIVNCFIASPPSNKKDSHPKDESLIVVPPFFTGSSRNRPLWVSAYSGTVTDAVSAEGYCMVHLQDSKVCSQPSHLLFHQPRSLCHDPDCYCSFSPSLLFVYHYITMPENWCQQKFENSFSKWKLFSKK